MLECNLDKILGKKKFISFHKVKDLNIFLEINVIYMFSKKHKCISEVI
jgi:hypothetical protein